MVWGGKSECEGGDRYIDLLFSQLEMEFSVFCFLFSESKKIKKIYELILKKRERAAMEERRLVFVFVSHPGN